MILQTLRRTMSRKDKEEIMRSATDNEKRIFKAAYDPKITYGIRFDKINWSSVNEPEKGMFDILGQLADRSLTGGAAENVVTNYANTYGDLIKLICNRDLDCGVTATTCNNTFGKDFIPQFKVQLAKEVPLDKIQYPCIAQVKYDGVRVLAFVNSKTQSVIFRTRNGKVFEYPELAKSLLNCSMPDLDFVFDGELTVGNSAHSNHTNVAGKVNSAIKGNPITGMPFNFHVFDGMQINDFNRQQCDMVYSTRYAMTKTLIDNMFNNRIIMADYVDIDTMKQANKAFTELYAQGFEGIIIKQWNHLYTFKRSTDWVKVKAIKTADLKCVSWVIGTGKYKDVIGTLICEGMVEGKFVSVKVGSGLTDNDRAEAPAHFLMRTIEVKYNSLIQDAKTGNWSLFLPRFVSVRIDK